MEVYDSVLLIAFLTLILYPIAVFCIERLCGGGSWGISVDSLAMKTLLHHSWFCFRESVGCDVIWIFGKLKQSRQTAP